MIVLDTQAWLWWTHDPSRLTPKARRAVEKAEKGEGIRVSVISVWEIALKNQLGKLELPQEIQEWLRLASTYPNLVVEPLSTQDALGSTKLPGEFHKDPADRFIVAMTRRYGTTLITSDALIQKYPHVTTVW